MAKDCVMAIDQGTTGTTIVLLGHDLNVIAKKNKEFPQHYPKPGWVEHKPEEIWECTINAIKEAFEESHMTSDRVAAVGITNQRETTILWDRKTGESVCNAIVWQDRRTASICDAMKKRGLEKKVQRKTGLLLDPYFSGTKLTWLMTNHPEIRERAVNGEICFGTVDSFLVYKLTGGRAHVTDVTNASRTLLMNLETLSWDAELLKLFKVPDKILPEIRSCSEVYGETRSVPGLPNGIPVAGIAGDQQAALFGQACFITGEAKCTYGTGSFLMMNTGGKIVRSKSRILTTVAWKVREKVVYALEGSAFIAGAAVQWLRDGLRIIKSAPEIESLARSVSDNGGVTFVPAFVGLGAPYWNANARGVIRGITRGTTRGHIARAALEGIALLQYGIVKAMENDFNKKLKILKVDGGACANNLLMQIQADVLGVELVRPKMIETTALGAAFLAGLAVGFWQDLEDIDIAWQEDKRFRPQADKKDVKELLDSWNAAVKCS